MGSTVVWMYHSMVGNSAGGPPGRPRRARRSARDHVLLRAAGGWWGRTGPRSSRQAGEARQPLERQVHLEGRARCAGSRRGARGSRPAGCSAPTQLARAEGVRVDHHHRARISSPLCERHALHAAPPAVRMRATVRAGVDAAPRLRAACASPGSPSPMPPSTIIQVPSEPGRRHMLWTRKFIPVPGVSQRAEQAGEAVGHRVHRLDQVALEPEPLQVVAHRAAAQLDEGAVAAQGARTARPSPRWTAAPRSQRGRDVVADLAQSPRCSRLVGVPVRLGEELHELAAASPRSSEPKSR